MEEGGSISFESLSKKSIVSIVQLNGYIYRGEGKELLYMIGKTMVLMILDIVWGASCSKWEIGRVEKSEKGDLMDG